MLCVGALHALPGFLIIKPAASEMTVSIIKSISGIRKFDCLSVLSFIFPCLISHSENTYRRIYTTIYKHTNLQYVDTSAVREVDFSQEKKKRCIKLICSQLMKSSLRVHLQLNDETSHIHFCDCAGEMKNATNL